MNSSTAQRILVVDDEPDVELLIKQKFRRKIKGGEFDFVFARDGQEALDTVQRDPDIGIVMSDINMPVMDGLTLLARLGELNRTMRVVIVSAYGDIGNIRTAMNRGAYDFLTKPIDFQDFEATVQKTIQELNVTREGQKLREQLLAIQQELSIAERIQQSMLPRNFRPYPDRGELDIYAEMVAARSVGGDFYDFFPIQSDRLGFVIGDVSGKGVPAAIFMAVCRTLLRATALQGLSPAECFNYMNGVLARQTDPSMYVTLLYGILNVGTGEVEYSLAAHNGPYVVPAHGPVRQVESPGAFMVGLIEKAEYENAALKLQPGDKLLLYTDGVTDAEDPREQPFSDERLHAALESLQPCPVQEIVKGVFASVKEFAAGALQSDDITVLALQYRG